MHFDKKIYNRFGFFVWVLVALGLNVGAMAQSQPNPKLLKYVQEVCKNGFPRKANYGRQAAQQMMEAGWRAVGSGEGAKAVEMFLGSLVGSERPDAYWGLGVASHVSGYSLMIINSCFKRASLKLGAEAALYSDHGRILEERNQPGQAIEVLKKALALDPNHLEAHIGMARAFQKLGDAENAQAHVSRVREIKKQLGK